MNGITKLLMLALVCSLPQKTNPFANHTSPGFTNKTRNIILTAGALRPDTLVMPLPKGLHGLSTRHPLNPAEESYKLCRFPCLPALGAAIPRQKYMQRFLGLCGSDPALSCIHASASHASPKLSVRIMPVIALPRKASLCPTAL